MMNLSMSTIDRILKYLISKEVNLLNIRICEKQGNVKLIFPNSVALNDFKQNHRL